MAGLHQPRSRKDFEIALICALPVEFNVVEALFDDYYDENSMHGNASSDPNAYTLGKMSNHNVVLACMPGIGKANSASLAANLHNSFPKIKLGIVMGICGGVPFGTDEEIEILLGDVIISTGLIQFDFGRQYSDGVVRKNTTQDNLARPNKEIGGFLAKLSSVRNRKILRDKTSSYLAELCTKDDFRHYSYPGADKDNLYQPTYRHKHQDPTICSTCASCRDWNDEVCNTAMESSCEEVLCEDVQLIRRARVEKAKGIGPSGHKLTNEELQKAQNPLVHFGLIASGDVVMKSGLHRDQIASTEKVIAFEMEAAGVWDHFPTVVVKSVCDYADSHKNKKWQSYAAATAAACTKAFLEEWRSADRLSQVSEIKDEVQAYWSVPFLKNERFVGQGDNLTKLEAMLLRTDSFYKIAITGLGGIGKTQIALELAYRVKRDHPLFSVFWVPATTAENFEQAYRGIGHLLKIPGVTDEKADFKLLVKQYLSQESNGRWLLVVDNADDIDIWFDKEISSKATKLIDFLPKSSQGVVLFTTRNRRAAVKLAQSNVIEVSEMGKQTATELLDKLLIHPEVLEDKQDALGLVQQLAYLPLAIVQAAAYLNENGIPISQYLSLLNDTEERVIEVLSEDFEDEGRYKESKNPIATTWLVSLRQIRQRNALAADYLSFMSCMDSKNIPQSLLPPAQSKKAMVDAIGTLDAYSFITRRPADRSFDLHRLVHLATRNWLQDEGLLMQWTNTAVSRLARVFSNYEYANRPLWRAYLPHARHVLASRAQNKAMENATLLQGWVGFSLLTDGKYSEAEELLLQVVETRKRVLGVEHPSTLTSLGNLALTYQNQGRWKEAEKLNVQVTETKKSVLGIEHPSTLTSIGNLALTYQDQGRYKEAEALNVQVTETSKEVLGVEHPNTLNGIRNLASTYQSQGRYKEAEELHVQVTEMSKKVLGAEHPDTLANMGNLALTYQDQGRWKEAEELIVQVTETKKRVLGIEHPSTLVSIRNLAAIYWTGGRWKEAEELTIEIIGTLKRVLGKDHPETLYGTSSLAWAYLRQGRRKEAEELEAHLLETKKRVLGEEHPNTLQSMHYLAHHWKLQGRDVEALALMNECVKLQTQVLGPKHPDTTRSLTALNKWQTANGKSIFGTYE